MLNRAVILTFGLVSLMWMCLASAVEAKELNIVSTSSIIGDYVRNVGGEFISQTVLVGANGDPHTFEPSPKDGVALKSADVVFEFGLHLEPWLDHLYQSSGSKAQRYRVTGGLMLIHGSDPEHDEIEVDPHVWHDVANAIIMVELIRDALMKADPEHAEQYRHNAELYLKKLSDLQDWIFQQTASLDKERRKLVTSHDTFGYFARRYGFQIIGAVVDSATTEAADPSASKIAGLSEKIKTAGVPAIFVENVSNPQTARAIARETGVRVAPPLYSDALGEPGSEGEDYVKMMTHNVKTIVEALK